MAKLTEQRVDRLEQKAEPDDYCPVVVGPSIMSRRAGGLGLSPIIVMCGDDADLC
jgi:hypothetical protein